MDFNEDKSKEVLEFTCMLLILAALGSRLKRSYYCIPHVVKCVTGGKYLQSQPASKFYSEITASETRYFLGDKSGRNSGSSEPRVLVVVVVVVRLV